MIQCRVEWSRGEAGFLDGRYHRSHRWTFDGGVVVPASSSPEIVPVPMSDPSAVDPEEAFVAALSSCHMLWFLAIAAKRRWIVDSYLDEAHGVMSYDTNGRLVVGEVLLRPAIVWGGADAPSGKNVAEMHHEAHAECFLANSVKTKIRIEHP